MKHDEILKQLVADAERTPNILGFLLFGSVATGTQREDSDIDVITVLRTGKPTSGIDNTPIEDIKVGNIFFTYEIFVHSVETVPYLLHPLGEAKLLFDREGSIEPLLEKIKDYFADNPEIVDEWNRYYGLLKQEKAEYGYEKTTIVDVWNELEKRHSGGKTKRRFFSSFYMTNPLIFSLLKKLL
ncbi:MAG: nucleotidyltransferase domain-containing protein [Anaerolineales bacterium]|nr:nucleotidyltransferase domain-containing protein [Anaerolineales bacterium]